ncbi:MULTISPECIES: (4Fe-4S)-binding protein [Bizionia]|uniref:(4Fe-4S)-binding protein n=1 Tax=Bizionia algoritergicola TaxID=291187 RepID=A0A5D0QVA9_9FLAO|nr:MULTISPECIES: (4Fe-4S)-binding protein [Bizionia]TYB72726.1 (4Fe-4S)-binding protein [Bizionia algoritergicola]
MRTKDQFFSNKDITVTYSPTKCMNAERCASELSNVFRQSVIPWIDLEGDSSENIINQVKKCPSGALQYCLNKKEAC